MQSKFIDPFRESWSKTLAGIASRPLKHREDFPEVASRWEKWWQFKSDRPLVPSSIRIGKPPRWDKGFDLIDKPEEWFDMHVKQVEAARQIVDGVPAIRLDIGPIVIGAFLGQPLEFRPNEGTSWQSPILHDWTTFTMPKLDHENRWLKAVLRLARYAAERSVGKFLISLPDLGGAIDTLASMRGTENLLLDLYDNPDRIIPAADQIMDAWEETFALLYHAIVDVGAGVSSWLGMWSSQPYTVATCDFNFMISKEQFRDYAMPSMSRQGRAAGRIAVHVDGPGAVKHAETLAADPNITAIQYTCGAGTPSAVAKMDMFKAVQKLGKPVIINTPYDEIKQLVETLDHRGLALRPDWINDMKQADELMHMIGAKKA